MVSIEWCLKQKDGIQLIEPNKNISGSYLKMAEESINILPGLNRSRLWSAVTSYYIFYYSLYSLMTRIGIKCEIHSCSLEFMKRYLVDFYSAKDFEMISKAFKARIDLQYYANRPVDGEVIEEIKKECKLFFISTKDSIAVLSDEQIDKIRNHVKKLS
ncbi:hypothetical protein HYU11_01665 [Candidatus Woesearchaeota archaeon]|nr:hypothetical protein [Candidatus Woesearchaeota archaeon]